MDIRPTSLSCHVFDLAACRSAQMQMSPQDLRHRFIEPSPQGVLSSHSKGRLNCHFLDPNLWQDFVQLAPHQGFLRPVRDAQFLEGANLYLWGEDQHAFFPNPSRASEILFNGILDIPKKPQAPISYDGYIDLDVIDPRKLADIRAQLRYGFTPIADSILHKRLGPQVVRALSPYESAFAENARLRLAAHHSDTWSEFGARSGLNADKPFNTYRLRFLQELEQRMDRISLLDQFQVVMSHRNLSFENYAKRFAEKLNDGEFQGSYVEFIVQLLSCEMSPGIKKEMAAFAIQLGEAYKKMVIRNHFRTNSEPSINFERPEAKTGLAEREFAILQPNSSDVLYRVSEVTPEEINQINTAKKQFNAVVGLEVLFKNPGSLHFDIAINPDPTSGEYHIYTTDLEAFKRLLSASLLYSWLMTKDSNQAKFVIEDTPFEVRIEDLSQETKIAILLTLAAKPKYSVLFSPTNIRDLLKCLPMSDQVEWIKAVFHNSEKAAEFFYTLGLLPSARLALQSAIDDLRKHKIVTQSSNDIHFWIIHRHDLTNRFLKHFVWPE